MGTTKHPGPQKLPARPDPKLWVSAVPFGLGKLKPKHIRDTMKTLWQNRDNLPYAARILTQGACDGCALGVSGLYDQTLAGPHICTTRLNVLRLNTMPAIKPNRLHADIEELRKLSSAELRELGRIPYPLIRRPGDRSFSRLSWGEALDKIAAKFRELPPEQTAFYLTARGITNESYYAAAKVARFLGTNHIDNASRICHSPSKTALKRSLGIGASSCSYRDWIGTDVLVFWGSVAANNQPVSTKYMYAAKRKGTKIIVINPYREPAMDGYWIPSIAESALFGTKLADDFYPVNIGGDIALMHGVMKTWFEMEQERPGSAIDHDFVWEHANGFEQLRDKVNAQHWGELESSSGLSRVRIKELAELLAGAKSAVFVWSMGLTQHRHATDNISQVVNLALLRGFIGREHCGVMPIRGHSGVQSAGEMGAEPSSLPGGDFNEDNLERLEQLWGFPVPRWQGDIVGVSLENTRLPITHPRKLKLYYLSGGNFLETMPDPQFVRESLEALEVRVHQDIILNTSTLLDAKEAVIILPAMTRYEQPGGGTSTSTERMVYFSPEIEGPRIPEARAEWQIYSDLAARVKPQLKDLVAFADSQAIRDEIARVAPEYDGIQHLKQKGEVFQRGGAWLCEGGVCPTPDGKGRLIPVDVPKRGASLAGEFYVTTRRGKQFNSMIYGEKDSFNGAIRAAVLLNPEDAHTYSISEGEAIVLHNSHGTLHGKAHFADIALGNLAVNFPEGNVLFPMGVYESTAGIPEFNIAVALEKAEYFLQRKDKSYNKKGSLE
ncbi:FdhF/YdeP family oxidoreductase [Cohnella luojiensis]|uniref:FdhF/YdeP family oxidoreductase n=1 Tax=Cohnella luojiensis TaxID=652876 RepID=A0A4Y8LV77_9BACL|nr:FdhF/YdeP family oxidoreductase [Cohnella luojiensis]TFE23689.1 FdhF/YdeP family oxidoreductase [Cohnella luojiensis]